MKREQITPQTTATPKGFTPDYDWRREPWVDDDRVRALAYYIANHLLTAMAAAGPGGATEQDEEDARVFLLLRPDLTEQAWKSAAADELIRHRESAAAAQGIDDLISEWLAGFGSVDRGPKEQAAAASN